MLRELTWEQFLEWQEFDKISTIGDKRGDWQAASIAAAVHNSAAMLGRSKHRVRVSDMLLEFAEEQKPAPVMKEGKRAEQDMKFIARMSVALSNAEEETAAKKKRKRR